VKGFDELKQSESSCKIGKPKEIYLYIDGHKIYFPKIKNIKINMVTDIIANSVMATAGYLRLEFKPHPLYFINGGIISLPMERIVFPTKDRDSVSSCQDEWLERAAVMGALEELRGCGCARCSKHIKEVIDYHFPGGSNEKDMQEL